MRHFHILVFAVLLAPKTHAQPAVIPPLAEGDRVTLASNLEAIWALDVLSDGRIIFTERPGRVQLLDGNGIHQVGSIPVVTGAEQGLFGIVAHPDFALNKAVYVMYTHTTGNRISRFTLAEDPPRLIDEQVIVDRMPSSTRHDGGRLKIGPDGKLYATLGDVLVPSDAQDVNSLAGKILRFELDGSVPNDNPFGNAVWSYGHRNPQGITWSPDGTAYSSEHGNRQLDEVNLIIRGGNYGWPTECGSGGDHIDPIWCTVGWTLAPGGIAYLHGALYVVGLRGAQLRRLVLSSDGQSVESEEQLFGDMGRLREVYAHNGILLIGTSNRDGRGTPEPDDDKLIAYRPTGVPVNVSPSFTSAPVTEATEDSPYTYTAAATDPDDDPLAFSEAAQLPAWLTLTDNGNGTATLSGTPANGDVGPNSVDLQVSDGALTDTQSFTITVANVNDPPVFTSTPLVVATEAQLYSYGITTSDPDAGETLTLTASVKPAWLELTDNGDGTGMLSGVPGDADVGANAVTIQLSDESVLVEQSFSITVEDVEHQPVFTTEPIQQVSQGEEYRYAAVAADADDDQLTFDAVQIPSWLTLVDNTDGSAILSGVPSNDDVGSHTIELSVTDNKAVIYQSWILVVGNVNDPPSAPEIVEPANGSSILIQGEPQDEITVQWTASVDLDGDTLTYGWQLSLSAAFEALVAEVSSTDTTITLSIGAIASALTQAGVALNETVTAYHRVFAYDGELHTPSPTAQVSVTRGAVTANENADVPFSTTLHQNYPNPFSSGTTISYTLPAVADVTITVMDLLGRTVRELARKSQPASKYEVLFDAEGLPSGAYIYRLEAGDYVETKRMIVVK